MNCPRHPAPIDSGLLARKGEARPAMRPHGTGDAVDPAEDLGWNDLGKPTPPLPPVLRDRAKLSALPPGPGDAVTLRLDADRLLRLRLAATVRNISVEAFVLEALDHRLPSTSDIAALVQRLAPNGAAKGTP